MCNNVIEVESEIVDNYQFKYYVNRKVWQILWDFIMTPLGFKQSGYDFSNDTFEHHPYSWDDSADISNNYHFYHKSSGLKIRWYKYPLRDAMCNMDITDTQFVDILYDCSNSVQNDTMPIKIIYDIDAWWDLNEETES